MHDEVRAHCTESIESRSVTAVKSSQRPSLLIVDDNEDAADLLAEALEASGFEVRVAHDGPAALALMRDYHPQLGVLDIGLPMMDGYELARELHALVPEIQLVALTAYGLPGDRARAFEAGFVAHVVKPADVDRLIETLNDLLH